MRRALPVIAAALTLIALPTCLNSDNSAQETALSTITSTVTAPNVPPKPSSPRPGNNADATTTVPPAAAPPPQDCGISPPNDAITAPVSPLEPPGAPNTAWVYKGVSNYDAFAELSYALLVQRLQGNSQFGTQILFFHRGEYIDIDSTYPQQAVNLEDRGNALVVT